MTMNLPPMQSLWYSLLIGIAGALIYSQTVGFEYVLDDAIVISENEFTSKGLHGIPEIWTYDSFRGFFKTEGKDKLVQGGRYRPLSMTSFALETELFGMHPWVHHLFTLLWYALLGWIIHRTMLLVWAKNTNGQVLATLSTILFMFHPVHSEVVANCKGRDEIMAMFFGFLALWFLLQSKNLPRLLGAALAFAAALFAKENAIGFYLLVPLSLWIAGHKHVFLSFLPLTLALGLYLAVRSYVLGGLWDDTISYELMNNPFLKWDGASYQPLSMIDRWPTAFSGILHYMKLFILPWPLTHDYYPLQIPLSDWSTLSSWIGLVASLACTIIALALIRKKHPFAFGWLWFIIFLFPVSNLVISVGTLLSERFVFLPSLGLCLILSFFLTRLVSFRKKWYWGIPAILVGIYCLLILWRLPAWESNYSLFTTDVEYSSQSAKANNAVAGEYNRLAGEAESKRVQKTYAEKAIPFLKKALQLHPTYSNAYLQLGNSYFYLEEYDQAIDRYMTCLRIKPNDQNALTNLHLAYRKAGKEAGEKSQNVTKAISYLQKAYEINPADYETIRLLGVAYAMRMNYRQAISYFAKALALQPNNAQANYNLGASYMNLGQIDSGQIYLQKAKQLDQSLFEKN